MDGKGLQWVKLPRSGHIRRQHDDLVGGQSGACEQAGLNAAMRRRESQRDEQQVAGWGFGFLHLFILSQSLSVQG